MFLCSPAGGAASPVLCGKGKAGPEAEDHPGRGRSAGCQNGELEQLVPLVPVTSLLSLVSLEPVTLLIPLVSLSLVPSQPHSHVTAPVTLRVLACVCSVGGGCDQEPRLPEAPKDPCSPEHRQDGKTVPYQPAFFLDDTPPAPPPCSQSPRLILAGQLTVKLPV